MDTNIILLSSAVGLLLALLIIRLCRQAKAVPAAGTPAVRKWRRATKRPMAEVRLERRIANKRARRARRINRVRRGA